MDEKYQLAREFGFRLSDEFIESDLSENPVLSESLETFPHFLNRLKNSDLRKKPFVTPFFESSIHSTHHGNIVLGPNPSKFIVLQIVSIGNISNLSTRRTEDTRNRLIGLQLTDGYTKVHAFEFAPVESLNSDLPPGSKILYSGGEVRQGKLLLNPQNCSYIGGEVVNLIETWKANNSALMMRKLLGIGKRMKSLRGSGEKEGDRPRFELKLTQITGNVSSPMAFQANSSTCNSTNLSVGKEKAKQNEGSRPSSTPLSYPAPSPSLPIPPPAPLVAKWERGVDIEHEHGRGRRGGGGGGRARGRGHREGRGGRGGHTSEEFTALTPPPPPPPNIISLSDFPSLSPSVSPSLDQSASPSPSPSLSSPSPSSALARRLIVGSLGGMRAIERSKELTVQQKREKELQERDRSKERLGIEDKMGGMKIAESRSPSFSSSSVLSTPQITSQSGGKPPPQVRGKGKGKFVSVNLEELEERDRSRGNASGGKLTEGGGVRWVCGSCTFENESGMNECEMCERKRV